MRRRLRAVTATLLLLGLLLSPLLLLVTVEALPVPLPPARFVVVTDASCPHS